VATITKLGFNIDSKYDGKGILQASSDLTKLRENMRKISGAHVRAKVDIDGISKAATDLRRVNEELRKISGVHAQAKVSVDGVGKSVGELRAMNEELRKLSGKHVQSKADVDIAAAQAKVQEFSEDLRRISGRHIQAKVDADVQPVFAPDFQARLNAIAIARDFHVPVRVELDESDFRARMGALTRPRSTRVRANGDQSSFAGVEAQLGFLTRLRNVVIRADSRGHASIMMARFAALALLVTIGGLTAAFYTLGAVGASVGALLTAALGGGVIAAGIAAITIQKKLTDQHSKAAEAARSQAQAAGNSLASAYRNAQTTAENGLRQIAQAEERARQAARTHAREVEKLPEAYRDARRELEDYQAKLRRAPLNQRSADLAVARARQRIADMATDDQPDSALDYAEAYHDLEEAELRRQEVMEENNRLQEDANEAFAKGVEGADAVVSAKQRVQDAEESLAQANQAVAQAQADAAEANRQAAEQVAQAQQAVAEASANLNQEMEKQNGLLAQAARYFADIASPLQGPLNNALVSLRQQLAELKPALTGMFAAAGPLVQPFLDAITGLAREALPGVTSALQQSVPIIEGMRDGLSSLGAHMGTMFDNMTQGAAGLGDTWRVWGNRFGEFLSVMGTGIGQTATDGARSLDLMLGGINELIRGLWDGLAPAMEHMAGGSSIWFSLFAGIGEVFRQMGPALGAFTEAIGGALGPAMQTLAGPVGQVLGAFLNSLTPIIIAVTPAIIAIANGFAFLLQQLNPIMPVLGPLVAGLWAVNAALTANPIGIVVVAVGALAGGIAYLATQTQFFQNLWNNFVPDAIVNFFRSGEEGTSGFSRAIGTLVEWGQRLWDLFGPSISRIFDALKGAFADIKTQWESNLKPALMGLFQQLEPLFQALKPILAVIGGAILAVINIALGILEHGIKPVVNFVMEAFTVLANAFRSVMQVAEGLAGVITGVVAIVVQIVETIGALFGSIFRWDDEFDFTIFRQKLGELGGMILDLFTGPLKTLGQGLLGIVDAIWDGIFAVFRGAFGVLTGIVRGIVQGVVGFFQWLWDVLVGHSIIPDTINAIVDWFKRAVEWVTTPVRALVDAVVAIWTTLWNTVSTVANTVWNAIKAAFTAWVDAIKFAFQFWVNLIKGLWEGLWNGISGFVTGIWDGLKRAWDIWLTGIRVAWEMFTATISDLWNKFWNGIRDFVVGVWDWVKKKWDDFLTGIKLAWELFKTVIGTAWDTFWNKIREIASGIWDRIKQAFNDFKGGIQSTLEALVGKAEEIWEKIKGIFARPINFVIDIWNNHIKDKIGLGDKAIPRIDGYADGGLVPGNGHGRADDRIVRVSSGEYIVNEKATRKARPILDAINYDRMPAFANGGPVDWMIGYVKSVSPEMQVTSTVRDSNDYHGQGKAVDFAMGMDSHGLASMFRLAENIAAEWGRNTLELIHGNGFMNNIDNGQNVGDGMSFFGPATMAGHNNHVHWAVDRPLDDKDRGFAGAGGMGSVGGSGGGGGFFGMVRNAISSLWETLTNPLINAIPDPFVPGMGGPMARTPKSLAEKVRNNIGDLIRGREKDMGGSYYGGDIGGQIPEGERLAIIEKALEITGTPPPGNKDAWIRGMNTLITRESNWNPNAVNNWDSNAAAGTPSKGLAQTIGPTFEAYKVPGYDNILDPVSNVAASINYIKNRYGSIENVQQANANMPPKGYEEGTQNATPGWHLVGENGPEMVKFRGGEEVHSFEDIVDRLRYAAGEAKLESRTMEAINGAVKANFDTFMSDLTGGSVEGGALPNLVKGIFSYGSALANQKRENHYHVGNMDEALKLDKEKQRQEAMGLYS